MRRVLIGLVLIVSLPLLLHPQTYWNLEPIWVKANPMDSVSTTNGYGTPTSLASGDINGDGISDFLVGGPGYIDSSGAGYGRLYCFFGGNDFDTLFDFLISSNTCDHLGDVVASGDVNGDGFDDILLGLFGSDIESSARLYLMSSTPDTIWDWQKTLLPPPTAFGFDVGLADVTGDGFADLIVGSPYEEGPPNDRGAVHIFFGPEPSQNTDLKIWGPIDAFNFGWRIETGYDVNGDGFNDIAVASPDNAPVGGVYIYYGGPELDDIPDVFCPPPIPFSEFGAILALVPDINGDGYDDLVVGDRVHNRAFIYWGSDSMDGIPDKVLYEGDGYDYGMAVGGIGDMNGDGLGEIAVGDPLFSDEKFGRVWLYLGGTPFDTICDGRATGTDTLQMIGWTVCGGGDFDNDGDVELIFTNYATVWQPKRIWLCKYTGAGLEEIDVSFSHSISLSASPNPSHGDVKISCYIPSGLYFSLDVLDVSGRVVKKIYKGNSQGRNEMIFKWKDDFGRSIPGGTYFLVLKSEGGKQRVKKIVRLR